MNTTKNSDTNLIHELPTVIKGANDKKEYRTIELQNGLRVCLISDAENIIDISKQKKDSFSSEEHSDDSESEFSDEYSDSLSKKKYTQNEEKLAAAALCVGVGSFSDPKLIPGMAHFLEHMVFMGSEKFPIENDFDVFIKKSGGSNNASTDGETTLFYFECPDQSLYTALDKFSQFFISPLLKHEAMTREREAIESEFQMALQRDSNRCEQLMFNLANEEHPANHFSYGNLITLRDNTSDEELYKGVHEFRKRHYSAHRMTLTVQARLKMSLLEQYVVDCFSAVPNNQLPSDDFKNITYNAFDTTSFKQLYYIKPVSDTCAVHLTWSLPSLINFYKSKPDDYISCLLGYEGKGSLLSYLRKKNLALNLTAETSETSSKHNTMFSLFSIEIGLTEKGLQNLEKVLEAVFSYINLICKSGPNERIFKEIQVISNNSFHFQPETIAIDNVCEIAEAMQYYPPEHYLTGSHLLFEYKPENIKKILEFIIPETVNIMVLSKKFHENINYNKIEKWFKTEYTNTDIPVEWLKQWTNVEIYDDFSLPEPNVYISENFEILNHKSNTKYPEKIFSCSIMEVWYRSDVKFKLPIAYMYFNFITPFSVSSPQNAVMLDLFVSIVNQQLAEEAYPAVMAHLQFEIGIEDTGVILKLDGFNEKLPLLLNLIVKYIHDFSNNLTEEIFISVKEKVKQSYYNSFIEPENLSEDLHLSILTLVHWTSVDKHTAILKITFNMIKDFGNQFLNHLYIQCLIQGNVLKEEAITISKSLIDTLQCDALLPNTLPQIRVCQIPIGDHCCPVFNFNIHDENSVTTNYYQSGALTTKNLVLVELLVMIISEPLFDVLRTKEQLGYHVISTVHNTFGILGFSISVHSQIGKYSTDFVNNRIENFIKYCINILNEMSDVEINDVKENLIKLKQITDVNLTTEVLRNWVQITSRKFIFDHLQQEIEIVKKLKPNDLRNWLEHHSQYGNKTNFRKISLQIIGHTSEEQGMMKLNEDSISSNKNNLINENAQQPFQDIITDNKFHQVIQYGKTPEFSLQFRTLNNLFQQKCVETSQNTCTCVKLVTDIENFKNELFIYPVYKF